MVADVVELIPKPLEDALLLPVKVIVPTEVLEAVNTPALVLAIAAPTVVIPLITIAPAEVLSAAE